MQGEARRTCEREFTTVPEDQHRSSEFINTDTKRDGHEIHKHLQGCRKRRSPFERRIGPDGKVDRGRYERPVGWSALKVACRALSARGCGSPQESRPLPTDLSRKPRNWSEGSLFLRRLSGKKRSNWLRISSRSSGTESASFAKSTRPGRNRAARQRRRHSRRTGLGFAWALDGGLARAD